MKKVIIIITSVAIGLFILIRIPINLRSNAYYYATYMPHKSNQYPFVPIFVNTDLKLSEITGLKMYFFTGLNAVLYVVPCNPSCDMIYQKF